MNKLKIKRKMMQRLITSVFLFVICIAGAPAQENITVGIGYQYGGIVGVKYNFKGEQDNFYASVGLLGGALGYQRFTDMSQQHAFGAMVGAEVLASESGFLALTYNYYPNGFSKSGWAFGASLGVRRTDEDVLNVGEIFGLDVEVKTTTLIGLNVGYTF
jgi:hypothetical protein